MEVLDVISIGSISTDVDNYKRFYDRLCEDKKNVKKEIRHLKKRKASVRMFDPFNLKREVSKYNCILRRVEEYRDEISLYLEAVGYVSDLGDVDFFVMLASNYDQLTSHYRDYKKYSDSLVSGVSCSYDCVNKPDIGKVKEFVLNNRVKSLNK